MTNLESRLQNLPDPTGAQLSMLPHQQQHHQAHPLQQTTTPPSLSEPSSFGTADQQNVSGASSGSSGLHDNAVAPSQQELDAFTQVRHFAVVPRNL